MPGDRQVLTQSLKPLVMVGHGAAQPAHFQNNIC